MSECDAHIKLIVIATQAIEEEMAVHLRSDGQLRIHIESDCL